MPQPEPTPPGDVVPLARAAPDEAFRLIRKAIERTKRKRIEEAETQTA